MTFSRDRSDVLQRLAVETYDRGLSTRDTESELVEATGDGLLSRTAASQVTEVLWEEDEAIVKHGPRAEGGAVDSKPAPPEDGLSEPSSDGR